MKLVFAVSARQDIADIYDYRAALSPMLAQKVEDKIRHCCEGLAEYPYASMSTADTNCTKY